MNKRTKEISKPSSKAIGKMIRISPYKLNLEAKSIRGKKVGDALSYLEFSKKRISNTVKNTLESAIANAENNHALDIDKLYVDCLLYTSPSPRDPKTSRMPSSA